MTTHSLFIPMKLKIRGGRKMIITSDTPRPEQSVQRDNTLIKAVAKAYWLQKQLNSGKYANLKDLALHHKLCLQYARQLFQLNFLSIPIKDAILYGKQPRTLKLQDLMQDIPILWQEQHERWGFSGK